MKKIFLFLLFTGLALLFVNQQSTIFAKKIARAQHSQIDRALETRIRQNTVQMHLVTPVLDAAGVPVTFYKNGQLEREIRISEGLGTMVNIAGEKRILTHDHWSVLSTNLLRVEFYDFAGNLLLTISGPEFLQSIQYRDGASMLLAAPDGLPVTTNKNQDRVIRRKSYVYVVYRPEGQSQLAIESALVDLVGIHEEKYSLFLQNESGVIFTRGSSGGGIWANEVLAGNLKARIIESPEGSAVLEPTAKSVAALLPLEKDLCRVNALFCP